MKFFISVACSLFLLGCSDNSTPPEITPVSTETPVAVHEENTPLQEAPAEETVTPSQALTTPAKVVETTVSPKPETVASAKESAVTGVNGASLYGQKCASCHGANAEKAALGKSQIIAQFSEAQVKEALKGYQAGSYGKEMKALMQGQAKGLSDAQIDALAKHIAGI